MSEETQVFIDKKSLNLLGTEKEKQELASVLNSLVSEGMLEKNWMRWKITS